ncbi:EamA family transporter [Castellaniella caeni]|uniref:EamA family transporter n=1 Tax=Castellaniella caeni TaxID=266123 RepID=UPI0009FE12E7|nr:DMT family transporter [Castellaniella caeni]
MKVAHWAGLGLAVLSAASFATSGVFAKGLFNAGWSPAAAAIWRITVGALVLLPFAVRELRGRWYLLRRHALEILLFGVVAVVGCQLAYYLAVQQLSVAVALLLEYCGVVLVVGWAWLRYGQKPGRLTVGGAGVAMVGLILVLGIIGGGVVINPVGVGWGCVAALCVAAYFVIAAGKVDRRLPPVAFAASGLVVGVVALALAGATGLVEVRWERADVTLLGTAIPWWGAVAELGAIAAALAYLTGVAAAQRLGPTIASFVSLSEVLFAALWAWLLLAETPGPLQQFGGLLVLAGIVLVRWGAHE